MDFLKTLNEYYPMCFDRHEQLRDGGSTSYAVFSGINKYLLRVIKPAFFDTAIMGADIQVYLQGKGFPVPAVVLTKDTLPYVKTDNELFILYEFIEGNDSDPEHDAEAIGTLVGKLHKEMKAYPSELVRRDKHFYIGRYIEILQKRQYPRISDYIAYGETLWNQMKDLPQGFCHGDMYDGNIRKALDGKLYIHDFDTSCIGFPMYDPTLICDMTKYFEFDERNYEKSNNVFSRFLPEYKKYSPLSQMEIDAFHPLIAVQHFSTQATVMECFGIDCLSDADIDKQLDWLYKWREQCEREASK
jgi:Ser/Thr protein kinase RdoA (MazF antagonist)